MKKKKKTACGSSKEMGCLHGGNECVSLHSIMVGNAEGRGSKNDWREEGGIERRLQVGEGGGGGGGGGGAIEG